MHCSVASSASCLLQPLINDVVLVIHGGIGRDPENQLNHLRNLDPELREARLGFERDFSLNPEPYKPPKPCKAL